MILLNLMTEFAAYLRPNLISALSSLDVNDFPHDALRIRVESVLSRLYRRPVFSLLPLCFSKSALASFLGRVLYRRDTLTCCRTDDVAHSVPASRSANRSTPDWCSEPQDDAASFSAPDITLSHAAKTVPLFAGPRFVLFPLQRNAKIHQQNWGLHCADSFSAEPCATISCISVRQMLFDTVIRCWFYFKELRKWLHQTNSLGTKKRYLDCLHGRHFDFS